MHQFNVKWQTLSTGDGWKVIFKKRNFSFLLTQFLLLSVKKIILCKLFSKRNFSLFYVFCFVAWEIAGGVGSFASFLKFSGNFWRDFEKFKTPPRLWYFMLLGLFKSKISHLSSKRQNVTSNSNFQHNRITTFSIIICLITSE